MYDEDAALYFLLSFRQDKNKNQEFLLENMKNLLCSNCNQQNPLFGGNDFVAEMLQEYSLKKTGDLDFSQQLLIITELGTCLTAW